MHGAAIGAVELAFSRGPKMTMHAPWLAAACSRDCFD
jgi:hypothetical protein